MATVTFDTMAFVDMLTLSCFDEKQAKGLANAIKEVAKDEHLTTKEESKADLSIIRSDIELTKRDLKADISASNLTMVKWLIALIIGQTALMITVLPKIIGH
jgi:hypothetical protein